MPDINIARPTPRLARRRIAVALAYATCLALAGWRDGAFLSSPSATDDGSSNAGIGHPDRRHHRHLTVTRDANSWPDPSARTASLSDRSDGAVRIAFRLRDAGEFGPRTDPMCPTATSGHNAGERLTELPPTLRDARSAREWEANYTAEMGVWHDPAAATAREEEYGDENGDGGRGGRILDFATSVATDLKVLWLGDSVAEQFGRAFDSAATGVPEAEALAYARAHNVTVAELPPDPRRVYQTFVAEGGVRECVFASGPVRGGGAVAMWRVVKLFSMMRMDLAACNSHQGGWSQDHLRQILDHEYRVPGGGGDGDDDDSGGNVTTIGRFDAVVLRIQLGWMPPRAITIQGIQEAIHLCRAKLGASTVVIMTINFTNDVHNAGEWAWAAAMNDEIRRLARRLNERNATTDGVDDDGGGGAPPLRVQVLEFSNFTTQVHWANARTVRDATGESFEYPYLVPPDPSLPDYDRRPEAHFLFDRFKPWHGQDKHPQSIPTVCARMIPGDVVRDVKRRRCTWNAIMRDGLHWCMSSVGPRYHAGVACLLGCVYNRRETTTGPDPENARVEMEQCERACNERFMSLVPLDESWLGDDVTLFSV